MKTFITKLRLGVQETGKTPTKPFSGAGNRTVSDVITDYFNGNLHYDFRETTNAAYERAIQQVLATAGIAFRPEHHEPLDYNYIYSIEDVDLPF